MFATIIRFLHSWNRWLLILAILIALVYFLYGWLTTQQWSRRGQILLSTVSSLVGLQWLLGVILLVGLGTETGLGVRHYWEHLFMQTIALAVAHLHVRWRKREVEDRKRYRRGLTLVAAVLLLIFAGIMVLPSPIQWRFLT